MTKYPTLLSPVKAGTVILKNRILSSNASPHFLQGPETYPAEGYRAYFAAIAKNAAVVTLAEWLIKPGQRSNDPNNWDDCHLEAFDMEDPSVHNYFSQLVDEVHFYNSKIMIAPRIKFPAGYSLNPGRKISFSPVPDMVDYKALPANMMPSVINDFIEKLKMYKNLGFDGVTIGLGEYLDPPVNPRKDEYGNQNIENRTRFIRELLAAIKKEIPTGFFVEGVLMWRNPNGHGPMSHAGYTEEDSVEFCKLADGLLDILQIREEDGPKSHPTGFSFEKGVHPTVDFAVRLRKEGIKHMLLEPIGGFQGPDEMEALLSEGKCDMIGVARGLIADYDYLDKIYQDRADEIVPCLKCNKCHGEVKKVGNNPWISTCAVNPIHGRIHKMGRLVPKKGEARKVAVIGGGPAGMRAALYAAERGHDVTLYEKSGVLGGQLIHADYFKFKWPLKEYKDWMITQMEKHHVKVILNSEVSKEDLKAEGYYAVIAATGAQPRLPKNIKGLRDAEGNALYPTCLDILGKEEELGKHVIIVGASETGTETGMYLAGLGHEVTLLTRQDMLAHDASMLHSITMALVKQMPDGCFREVPAWEAYDNLHALLKVTTVAVEGNTVTYVDERDVTHTISGDSVVICGGMDPRTDEALAYAGVSDKFFAAGDCTGVGNLTGCTRDAYSAAVNI